MIYIIEMIDDLNEVEQDVLEEIDPDLVSYSFSTRGGDQLIYLYKVYQIKKKLTTADGLIRIQWRCKDREHCKTTVRLLSLRENILVQADYNIRSLGIEHSALCNVNATSIIIEQFKKELIERASILHDMVDFHSQQLMYENLAGEYANLELHPEVIPGLILPTFYTVSSTSVGIDGIDSGKWFYWNKGKNYISQDTAVLPTLTTQSISISYYGLIKILVQCDNTDAQSEMKDIQYYSTGIYSKIEEVASIEDREEAVNYANGLLYQYRYMPETIEIMTNCRRDVGNMVNIIYPELTNEQLYFIESRKITFSNNTIYYNYKLLNGESKGNWTEFFRKLQLKSNDMLINEDTQLIKVQHMTEEIKFGANYGIVATTPLYVNTTTILDTTTILGGTVMSTEVLYDL